MPPRSNRYQRLVLAIERQLQPAGATVTESAMVKDRTGESREIDILIETSSGDHPIRIGVECRDHGQKCDVTWIEQLEGRFRDLPIDKVIAVSKSGFTKGAVKKAAAFGIRTLDFGQAQVEDWVIQLNPVRGVCITSPHFEIRHADFEIAGAVPPDLPKRLRRAAIRCPRFKYPVTLNQILDFIALSPDGRGQLETLQTQHPGNQLGVEVNLDAKGWTLIDRRRRYNLTRIKVIALVTTETTNVSLSASNYGKTPVLHGYAHGTALGYSVNMAPATDPAAPIHIQVTQAGHHSL